MSDSGQVAEPGPKESGPELPSAKRVLGIFAHPDDAEFTCAGTAARWASEGHQITYCIVTDGSGGSDDPAVTPEELARTREAEQREACRILGVKDVIFMGRQDGTIVPDLELRRDLVRIIRHVKPNVVICGDPTLFWVGQEYINHPDHRAVAEAALAALFPAAGNRNYFPELLKDGLEPFKIKEVYVGSPAIADTWIDITDFIDQKIEALRAHKSQLRDWDPEESIREWNAADGARHDPPVPYAEDFRYFKIEG
jgi:LmbE family N-acetylglucosaminyl deacetylase